MQSIWQRPNEDENIPSNYMHHVAIVDTIEVQNKTKLIVSTWGDMALIDYDELYDSWQSGAASGATMTYFTKAESRIETILSRLDAHVKLTESLTAVLRNAPPAN